MVNDPYASRIDEFKKVKRVMLVDDDQPILNLFKNWMEMFDYYTPENSALTGKENYRLLILASDGYKALEELEKLNKYDLLPHLILLDVKMPGISGDKVCEKLKSDPKYSHIPIYYLSGKPISDLEKLKEESRADGYFQKPVDVKKFIKTVDEVLSDSGVNKNVKK